MIPAKLHYCWFGGKPLPELVQKCIASWKKNCPNYEIMEWNESNFDINCCAYVREAYEAEKWAFVSDVVRLYALVTQGGIYMDTDVEVLRALDDILEYNAVLGFESESRIATAFMACEKGQTFFQELLSEYERIHFVRTDGTYDLTTNVVRISKACLDYGFRLNNECQVKKGFVLFPKIFFSPKDCETGVLDASEQTYTIHHFDGSWLSIEDRYFAEFRKGYSKFFPEKIASYIAKFRAILKCQGFSEAMGNTLRWLRTKL